jgi:hypothetical protein
MWCNACCRCGGSEMIECLVRETCTIHDVLTKCNLNSASDIRLQLLLDHIRQLQPRTVKRNDVAELSAILTPTSPSLLWSVAFQCLANQSSTVLELDGVLDEAMWSCRVYDSVRYRWLNVWKNARRSQGIQITSEEWMRMFSAVAETTNWTAFAVEHATDFLALPFGTKSTTVLQHQRASDAFVIHVKLHHVLPCLSVIRRHSPFAIWQCLYCMLQYCEVVVHADPIDHENVAVMVTICDDFVAMGVAEGMEDALVFECAVNALYALTSGTVVPGVRNDTANLIRLPLGRLGSCTTGGIYVSHKPKSCIYVSCIENQRQLILPAGTIFPRYYTPNAATIMNVF